jgi:hypothetical protein
VPEIGTAESTIRTALLAEDLVAYRNKKRIGVDELTPEELSLLRYSMPEMCGAAIGYIHDLGVVPIAIEEGAFPYVPSPELGRITVYVEIGRTRSSASCTSIWTPTTPRPSARRRLCL